MIIKTHIFLVFSLLTKRDRGKNEKINTTNSFSLLTSYILNDVPKIVLINGVNREGNKRCSCEVSFLYELSGYSYALVYHLGFMTTQPS
ncbi:unnamed protein product [Ceratitis capitata]|uniref:(Mediterranean fruit fly) hypothetical protein n=1 Tax=Ceratitis capitata TaxID=7213 RepID=A0A811UBG4_CERCA|nr:unnamed protein product [Ceratitis capitata]